MFNLWYKHGVGKNWFKNPENSLWITLNSNLVQSFLPITYFSVVKYLRNLTQWMISLPYSVQTFKMILQQNGMLWMNEISQDATHCGLPVVMPYGVIKLVQHWFSYICRRYADVWSHPSHYAVHPPSPPWSHKSISWSWMDDSHPFRSMSIGRPIPEIKLFQTLTLKFQLQDQGHGCGQRARSYNRPSIISTHFVFISHHSDQQFLK